MLKEFYKATNDQMFKAIFTLKKNRPLLKEFIKRSLRNIEEIDLDDLKILSSEIPKTNIAVKGKTVDVLAETKYHILNIELNNGYYLSLSRRNAAYIFSKYSEEVKVSETYDKMKTFIQINFTKGLGQKGRSVEVYTLKNKYNDKTYIDNLIIIEFNIDKIKHEWYNGNKELAFIAALDAGINELDEICEGDEYMELFEKEVKRLNENQKFTAFMTPEEENEKLIKTLASEARTEGLKIGEKLGQKRGEEIGQKENNLKVARKMKQNNIALDMISKITGLSPKEIEALK